MRILLIILKIIGILLLAILLIMVLLVFYPVSYWLEGTIEKELSLHGRISWLFRIVRLEFELKDHALKLKPGILCFHWNLGGTKPDDKADSNKPSKAPKKSRTKESEEVLAGGNPEETNPEQSPETQREIKSESEKSESQMVSGDPEGFQREMNTELSEESRKNANAEQSEESRKNANAEQSEESRKNANAEQSEESWKIANAEQSEESRKNTNAEQSEETRKNANAEQSEELRKEPDAENSAGFLKKVQSGAKKASGWKDRIGTIRAEAADERNKMAISHMWQEVLYLLSHLKPKYIQAEIDFAAGDPAVTGQATGILSLLPIMYQKGVHVYPDFTSEEVYVRGSFCIKGHMALFHMIRCLIRIWKDKNIKRLFYKFRK